MERGLISVFVGEQWYEADVLTRTVSRFKSLGARLALAQWRRRSFWRIHGILEASEGALQIHEHTRGSVWAGVKKERGENTKAMETV